MKIVSVQVAEKEILPTATKKNYVTKVFCKKNYQTILFGKIATEH